MANQASNSEAGVIHTASIVHLTVSSDDDASCPLCSAMMTQAGVEEVVPFEFLLALGIELPPPYRVPEESLEPLLVSIVDALASMRVFLELTDHLSDRELYEILWSEVLREEVWMSDHRDAATFLSLCRYEAEDTEAWLRYYADDEERSRWALDCRAEVPPHCELPYDRDRFLPQPQFDEG